MPRKKEEDTGGLTQNQLRVIDFILDEPGATNVELGCMAGVSGRTVQRWRAKPEFKQRLVDKAKNQLLSQTPALYSVLLQESLSKDPKYVKLALDHIEFLLKIEHEATQSENTKYIVEWRDTTKTEDIG